MSARVCVCVWASACIASRCLHHTCVKLSCQIIICLCVIPVTRFQHKYINKAVWQSAERESGKRCTQRQCGAYAVASRFIIVSIDFNIIIWKCVQCAMCCHYPASAMTLRVFDVTGYWVKPFLPVKVYAIALMVQVMCNQCLIFALFIFSLPFPFLASFFLCHRHRYRSRCRIARARHNIASVHP